jgi:general nucleoside transport system permease protein
VTTADAAEVSVPRRRRGMPDAAWSALGVVASLGFLAPLLALAGQDISEGYDILFSASFGSTADVSFLLLASTPLVLVGLGVALPLRAGMFNLGGEGQLLAGAIVAVWVATSMSWADDLPLSFLIPLVAAAAAGALVGGFAGALRAWRRVSEVVTTLMLSFIILLLAQYLVSGPLEVENAVYPATDIVPFGYRLTGAGPDQLIRTGFVIAVVVAVGVWLLTQFTRLGWRQQMIGLNPRVAARQGISVGREGTIALAIGGALAGLGGAVELLGNQLRVGFVFSPGWGFDAIVIALLARGNALAVIPFALYFGFLRNGALVLQQELQVSPDLVLAMGGAPVILVAAIIGYRAYRRFVAEPAPD